MTIAAIVTARGLGEIIHQRIAGRKPACRPRTGACFFLAGLVFKVHDIMRPTDSPPARLGNRAKTTGNRAGTINAMGSGHGAVIDDMQRCVQQNIMLVDPC